MVASGSPGSATARLRWSTENWALPRAVGACGRETATSGGWSSSCEAAMPGRRSSGPWWGRKSTCGGSDGRRHVLRALVGKQPRRLGRSPTLIGGDGGLLLQRQADGVEAVQKAVFPERIDVESMDRPLRRADRLGGQVDRQAVSLVGGRGFKERLHRVGLQD